MQLTYRGAHYTVLNQSVETIETDLKATTADVPPSAEGFLRWYQKEVALSNALMAQAELGVAFHFGRLLDKG